MDKNCFNYLIDLALDMKDFAWVKEIKQMEENYKHNRRINSVGDVIVNSNGILDVKEISLIREGEGLFATFFIQNPQKDENSSKNDEIEVFMRFMINKLRLEGLDGF